MKGKASKYFLCIVLIFQGGLSLAQKDFYRYKSELAGLEVGWNKLTIPVEVYSKVNDDYSDIRILGLTKSGDTLEAPYIIRSERGEQRTMEINFTLINISERSGDYYYTFALDELTTINEIKLNFEQTNFDWRVALEGSQDQKEWFSILSNYRVVSIQNDLTDYTFSTLSFPESKYAYYRVKVVTPDEKPVLNASSLFLNTQKEGTLKKVSTTKTTVSRIKDQNLSKINIYFEHVVPVSLLRINVADTFDYYRHFSVQAVTDSTETPAGWHVITTNVTSGILSSLEENEFHVTPVFTDHLVITISNYDNAPLNFGAIEAGYYPSHILFRVSEQADHYFFYGNKNARLPIYDVSRFAGNIPDDINVVDAGDVFTMEQHAQADLSLLKNKIWLWIAICVVIVILGWFTLKMMRS